MVCRHVIVINYAYYCSTDPRSIWPTGCLQEQDRRHCQLCRSVAKKWQRTTGQMGQRDRQDKWTDRTGSAVAQLQVMLLRFLVKVEERAQGKFSGRLQGSRVLVVEVGEAVGSLFSLFEGKWRREMEIANMPNWNVRAGSFAEKQRIKPPLVALPRGKNERKHGEIKEFTEI